MRTRIKEYIFTPGTRSIDTGISDLTIQDIRLIVNETQKTIICSSMQKDNITNITNGVITYIDDLPLLNDEDLLTIEIDNGDSIEPIDDLITEVKTGKQLIAQAITDKGIQASADESLSELAEKVSEINWNPNVGLVWDEGYKPRNVLDVFNYAPHLIEINVDSFLNIESGYLTPFINLEKITLHSSIISNGVFNVHYLVDWSTKLKFVNLLNIIEISITTGSGAAIATDVELNCPKVTRVNSGSGYIGLDRHYVYKSMVFGTLELFNVNANTQQQQYRLRNITVGENTDITLNFSMFWDARDVIAEGQSGVDELNLNIQNNLVANLKDNTGLTAKTVTFVQGLRNILTTETEQMFANKNWNIAPAKTV